MCAAILEELVGRRAGDELALRAAIQRMVPRWLPSPIPSQGSGAVDERAGVVVEASIC